MDTEVLELIAEILSVPVEELTPELSIGDISSWSSMAQMGIIATLEKRLGIDIPLEDLFEMTSVQGILDEVKKLKG